MNLEFSVEKGAPKVGAVLATAAVVAILAFAIVRNYFIGTLGDERAARSPETLASAVAWLPDSAPLLARLAATEMQKGDRDLSSAEDFASRAMKMSPWDYRHRLLSAKIKEAQGDRGAAEQRLQEAIALAPNYKDVHWRLANLLLREGKLAKSIAEFRSATALDVSLLPETLDLLWRVTGNNLAAIQAVTPREPRARIVLAQFLLKQSRIPDAVSVFGGIERDALLANAETPRFIESLVNEGYVEEANRVWLAVLTGNQLDPNVARIWNGGFESEISAALNTFDWNISRNDYVAAMIDTGTAHSGDRSLRLDFLGRDTTRLDGQVKQVMLLKPGAAYRIICFVKTQDLITPEGPRIVVLDPKSSVEIASSEPIAAGSKDWQRVVVDFNAPLNVRTAQVTIRRVARFSYDDPTRGTVWFDDFMLSEQSQK